MANSSSSSASGGIGLGGLLFVLFLGLKLGHVIDWSWWWVTAPLWIPVALAVGILGIVAIVAGFAFIFAGRR
jgi:hypothetical protein